MSSLWLAVAMVVLGLVCLLGAFVVYQSMSPQEAAPILGRWQLFQRMVSLAAVGAGLMLAGLIILYVELFPPPHSML